MQTTSLLSLGRQARFWFIAFLVAALVVWLLRDILAPFVLGLAIAYLLDPLTGRLVRWGLPRGLATIITLLLFFLLIVLAVMAVVPVVTQQFAGFLAALPGYVDMLRAHVEPFLQQYIGQLGDEDFQKLREAVGAQAGRIAVVAGEVLGGAWRGGQVLLGLVSFIVIMPIVAFYLLRDWPVIVAKVRGWLPRHRARAIEEVGVAVDKVLAGFVRGQLSVCVVQGGIYAIGLSMVGLNFAIVIGMMAGLLSFIPYVGSVFGLGVALLVAVAQFGLETQLLMVLAVFAVGQFLEGNFITPKLVGESVGLHPIWIIFAIMAGGSLLGFVGMLLAVPVAAVIGVGLRLGISRYMNSSYYRGDVHESGPRRRIRPL